MKTDLIVEVAANAVFEVAYPFVKDIYEHYDGSKKPCWKPGTAIECDAYSEKEMADGMGKQVLRVVSVHKPGRYPTRVFFTRQWIDPDGVAFGKPKLRIKTIGTFKQLVKGYGFNVNSWRGIEFELRTEAA